MTLAKRIASLEKQTSAACGARIFLTNDETTYTEHTSEGARFYTRAEVDALEASGWDILIISIVRGENEK